MDIMPVYYTALSASYRDGLFSRTARKCVNIMYIHKKVLLNFYTLCVHKALLQAVARQVTRSIVVLSQVSYPERQLSQHFLLQTLPLANYYFWAHLLSRD